MGMVPLKITNLVFTSDPLQLSKVLSLIYHIVFISQPFICCNLIRQPFCKQ